MLKIFVLFILIVGASLLSNGTTPQRKAYIEKYHSYAVAEMERAQIPASITLAQGILESGGAQSRLSQEGNNHFGIKCHKEWVGPSMKHDDDAPNECFRVYADPYESYRDHSEFLTTRSRYDGLFELDKNDYKGWARGLKKAGYATNPKYADLLIKIIEENELYKYDALTLADVDFEIEPIKPKTDDHLLAKHTPKKPVQKESNQPKTTVKQPVKTKPTPTKTTKPTRTRKGKYKVNGVTAVQAKAGDSPLKIAARFGIEARKVSKYNEIGLNERFDAGEHVFLSPKKKSANKRAHKVNSGETMHQIAQMYGVKVRSLRKINGVKANEEPAPGQSIALKGKRKGPLKTLVYKEWFQKLVAKN